MSTSVKTSPLAGVTVAAAMSPGLLACPPGAPLRTVAAIMAVNEVHAVLLTGGPSDSPAVVTDLDLVAAAGSLGAPATSAAGAPATIAPDATLAAAAETIAREGRSHLVVVAPGDGH